jgi:hypothetical protein
MPFEEEGDRTENPQHGEKLDKTTGKSSQGVGILDPGKKYPQRGQGRFPPSGLDP